MSFDLESPNVLAAHDFQQPFQIMAQFSPLPTAIIDPRDFVLRYVNPAFSQLVRKTPSQIIGQLFSDVLDAVNDGDILMMLRRVLETGEPEHISEIARRLEPVEYWSCSLWPLKSQRDHTLGLMVQIFDTTEAVTFRKRSVDMNQALLASALSQHELTETAERLNEELQMANEAKNQFLAVMSHEIRTPLNAIMGFSELLSHSNQDETDREVFADRLKRNSKLLLRLIDDILDLSKVEAGKLEIETIEFNLGESFADVEMIMRHLAEEKGIAFSFHYEHLLSKIIISDPTRLKQILSNIIGNSIKFTSSGSVSVTVETNTNEGLLCVRVKDTGSGMSDSDRAKLFRPFTQGNATTTRKFGGTGLGLDLSRRLARHLGGDVILMESEIGKGSVFEIRIALVEPKSSAAPILPKKRDMSGYARLDGLKILLAEDAPDNQFLISRYLTAAGASVVIANDGEEAVTKAMSNHFDIVLMDIQMPKLDGYSATQMLRKNGFKDPVVALTAHAMQGEVERCKLAGCNSHLAKPVARKDLVDVVHHIISNKTNSEHFVSRSTLLN